MVSSGVKNAASDGDLSFHVVDSRSVDIPTEYNASSQESVVEGI